MSVKPLTANLRSAREAQGLSQEGLARRLGVSWMTVSRYERGLAEPSIERLRQIAAELGTTPSELLGEGRAA